MYKSIQELLEAEKPALNAILFPVAFLSKNYEVAIPVIIRLKSQDKPPFSIGELWLRSFGFDEVEPNWARYEVSADGICLSRGALAMVDDDWVLSNEDYKSERW